MELDIPEKYTFPAIFVDGELWFGRGSFNEAQKLIHSAGTNWPCFRAIGFDNPASEFANLPFEARYDSLVNGIPHDHTWLLLAPRQKLSDKSKLSTNLQSILEDGGEGIMLRKPKSVYEHGRSTALLKLKAARGDKEGLVVETEGGSVVLQLPDGDFVEITGKAPIELSSGDIVTFAFENYSKTEGYVNPTITRVRTDVIWDDLVLNQDKIPQQELNDSSKKALGEPPSLADKKSRMQLFMEGFAQELRFDPRIPGNWYSRSDVFSRTKGSDLVLSHYKGSYVKALQDIFPDIGLDPNKFSRVTRGYWQDIYNRREFFTSYAMEMGFDPQMADNWYPVQYLDTLLERKGAGSILFYYNGSFENALVHVFPDIGLDVSKFVRKGKLKFDTDYAKLVLQRFAMKKEFEPHVAKHWYTVVLSEFLKSKGAARILFHYGGNFADAVTRLFPNIKFDRSQFEHTLNSYWQDKDKKSLVFNQLAADVKSNQDIPSSRSDSSSSDIVEKFKDDLNHLTTKLHVHELEDWYSISKAHMQHFLKSGALFKAYESVEAIVKAAYPTHRWDHDNFVQRGNTNTPQTFLQRIVRTLFGKDVPMKINARSGHGLRGAHGNSLEIDIYIPSLKLGFEYQDPHHYFHSSYGKDTLAEYQERDRKKQEQAAHNGITLIDVPFWWDWNQDSLISAIQSRRSDLLPNLTSSAPPLSNEPPQHILDKWNFDIPDFGIPMLALYSPQSRNFDPTNWWMFEKYDGIRMVWNNSERQFYSRWGKLLHFPQYFTDSIANDIWLDGELWFGREKGKRYEAVKVSKLASHIKWDEMKYVIFDTPDPTIKNEAYSARYQRLESYVPKNNPFVQLVDYHIADGKEAVEKFFFDIRATGGEGVILRDPNAPYIHGYSRHLYKHKGYQDAEAKIVSKISDTRFLCKIHRTHLLHNLRGPQEQQPDENDDQKFLEVEMSIDDEFDGDSLDIKAGSFVSFRYAGSYDKGMGPLVNPKISFTFWILL